MYNTNHFCVFLRFDVLFLILLNAYSIIACRNMGMTEAVQSYRVDLVVLRSRHRSKNFHGSTVVGHPSSTANANAACEQHCDGGDVGADVWTTFTASPQPPPPHSTAAPALSSLWCWALSFCVCCCRARASARVSKRRFVYVLWPTGVWRVPTYCVQYIARPRFFGPSKSPIEIVLSTSTTNTRRTLVGWRVALRFREHIFALVLPFFASGKCTCSLKRRPL